VTTPQVIAGTVDSYTDPTHPNANFGQASHLRCGSSREAYLTFSVPIPNGSPPLAQAVLDLNITGDGFGTATTIEVAVVTQQWRERTITHANKPTVGATATFSISGAVGAAKTFDLTSLLSSVFGISPFYGLRIRATAGGTAGNKQFGSSENAKTSYRPILRITWAQVPDAPTKLVPDEALTITTATPKLGWNIGQQQEDLDAFQVQVSTGSATIAGGGFATTVHDSGWQVTTETQYLLPLSLTASTTYYWHVRVRSALGVIGKWSGAAEFKYVALPTLTVTAPSASGETDTPLVQWTFTGQQSAKVALLLNKKVVSDYQLTTATQFEIPRGTKKKPAIDEKAVLYEIRLRVWDALDRVTTPGAPAYREAIIPYTWNPTGVIAPVTALAVAPQANGYAVDVTWTRATTCDKYAIKQNGKLLDTIDSGNVALGGTSYKWTRYDLSPKRNVTILAGVVQANGTVHWSVDVNVMLNWCPVGVWVYDIDANEAVQVMVEPGGLEMQRESDREVHLPLGREDPVVFQTTQRGWVGDIEGLVMSTADRDKLVRIIRRNIFDGNECQVMGPDLNLQSDLGDPSIVAVQPAGYYEVTVPFVQVAGPWNW